MVVGDTASKAENEIGLVKIEDDFIEDDFIVETCARTPCQELIKIWRTNDFVIHG